MSVMLRVCTLFLFSWKWFENTTTEINKNDCPTDKCMVLGAPMFLLKAQGVAWMLYHMVPTGS